MDKVCESKDDADFQVPYKMARIVFMFEFNKWYFLWAAE